MEQEKTAGMWWLEIQKQAQSLMRSDLFLEAADYEMGKKNLSVDEYVRGQIQVTSVKIVTDEQAEEFKRPKGQYVTIYSSGLLKESEEIQEQAVKELVFWIQTLLPNDAKSILVAGLGNERAVPDALGPDTVSGLSAELFYKEEIQPSCFQVYAFSPGVMAQTGMETADMIGGITKQIQPDAILVIDALASKSVTRLGTTIQLTDTGISPGAGVGNARCEISQNQYKIPVLAIGVPMVVEAASIIYETVEAIRNAMKHAKSGNSDFLTCLTKKEQMELFRELLEEKASPLYVTVKEIDEIEKRLSFTIAEALNRVFRGMKYGESAYE